jgi:hypothetical protein
MSWSLSTTGKCSPEIARKLIEEREPSSSASDEEKASFVFCRDALLGLIDRVPKSPKFVVAVDVMASGHESDVSALKFETIYVRVSY